MKVRRLLIIAAIGMMTLACGFLGGKEEAETEAEAQQPSAVEAIPEVKSAPAERQSRKRSKSRKPRQPRHQSRRRRPRRW